MARLEKCSAGVQTDSVVKEKDPELIQVLKDALQALLAEKFVHVFWVIFQYCFSFLCRRLRRDERKSGAHKVVNESSNSSVSSLYAVINQTGQGCGQEQERAMSTPQACGCSEGKF